MRQNHPTVQEMREKPQLAQFGERGLALAEKRGETVLLQNAQGLIEQVQRIRFFRQTWVMTTKIGTFQICYDSKAEQGEVTYEQRLHDFGGGSDKRRLIENVRSAIKRNLMCWR